MAAKGGADDRPWLLDLFSGAAIGADGYVRAGWRVRCVDNNPAALAWCPWEKMEADALEVLRDRDYLSMFQAIHASPPCQAFTAARELAKAQGKGNSKKAVDLLTPTLELLADIDIPWVVENVERSPLKGRGDVVRLCGSSFGLKVQRHRLFASNVSLVGTECDHATFEADPKTGKPRPWGVWYAPNDDIPSGGRSARSLEHGMEVMGVGRMVPWDHLKEGIPPAYTHHIGQQLMAHVKAVAA